MAQFDYQTYSAQQANKRANSPAGGKSGAQTHFVNEWLKNDGDSVVVRFPYHSMDDIKFETTHTVTFPGEKFGKRVRCEGDGCPLCKQGVKLDVRFFVKAIVYVTDPTTGNVNLVPAIWDRPAAFADIDLKNLLAEYDDLTESLFKIKRNGSGLDTRYTISIITNKTVYNPSVYKADFSGLDEIDPARVLTKSVEQYMKALNPNTETKSESKNLENLIPNEQEEKEIERNLNMDKPAQPTYSEQPEYRRPVTPQPAPTEDAPAANKPKRYTF